MTSSNGNIFRATGPLCGEFTGPGEFPTQRPVTRSFDVYFDLRLNKRLSKQPWGWWFETLSWSLWRHRNVIEGNHQSWVWTSGSPDHLWLPHTKGRKHRAFVFSLILDWTSNRTNSRVVGDLRRPDAHVAWNPYHADVRDVVDQASHRTPEYSRLEGETFTPPAGQN